VNFSPRCRYSLFYCEVSSKYIVMVYFSPSIVIV